MKKAVLLACALIGLTGCTDADSATKALLASGYTDIKLTGYKVLACSEDDTFRTGFTAKGPTGVPVSGTVCSGVFKGKTIRLD